MVLKEDKEFANRGQHKGNVRRETSAVSGMRVMIMHQNRHRKPLHPLSLNDTRWERVEKKKRQKQKSDWQNSSDSRAENFLKGTCTKSPCDYWHPPECQFRSQNRDVNSAVSARFPHWKVEEQPNKSRQRVVTKVQWLLWKMYDSWVAYHRTLSHRNP